MYNKAGKNIKTVAKIVLVVGIILSLIVSIWLFVKAGEAYNREHYYDQYDYFDVRSSSTIGFSEYYVPAGLCVLFGGVLTSIIRFFIIYGFGEAIDIYLNGKNAESNVKGEPKRWRCTNCGVINTGENCINCNMNRHTQQIPEVQ